MPKKGNTLSLSQPRSSSPVQRYFKLGAKQGSINFWDKEAKEEVNVPTPWKFIVLDSLSAIGGFHKASRSGIFSNEVRNLKEEKLVVRNREGVLVEGLYADIKEKAQVKGGKFANSIYIAFNEGGEWKLGNLHVVGAGFGAWVEFKKNRNLDREPGVGIAEWTAEVNGDTNFYAPVFKGWQVSPEDLAAAEELDRQLQQYLAARTAPKAEADDAPKWDSPKDDPWASAPKQEAFSGGGFSEQAPF